MGESDPSTAPPGGGTTQDAQRVVFRYVAERNPEGAFLPGVPRRDLTAGDLAEMPAWLVESVAATPFYVAENKRRTGKRPQMEE